MYEKKSEIVKWKSMKWRSFWCIEHEVYTVKILLQGFEILSCKVWSFCCHEIFLKSFKKISWKIPRKTPLFKKFSWKVLWKFLEKLHESNMKSYMNIWWKVSRNFHKKWGFSREFSWKFLEKFSRKFFENVFMIVSRNISRKFLLCTARPAPLRTDAACNYIPTSKKHAMFFCLNNIQDLLDLW